MAQRTEADVRGRLIELGSGFSGTIGVWAKNLTTGDTVVLNDAEPFETASSIKALIMVEAYQRIADGELSLSDPITYRKSQHVVGSGVLRDLTVGLSLSAKDTITLMIVVSDNVATNMMIDRLGIDRINARAQKLGLADTRLLSRLDIDQPTHTGEFGRSTPRDLGMLMERLYRGTAVSYEADKQMVEIMLRQQYNTVLTRRLPYSLLVPPEGKDTRPPVQVASKSGSWEGVRNDAGLVLTPRISYAVCIMSKGCSDMRFHVDNEAMRVLPELSLALFTHFYGEV